MSIFLVAFLIIVPFVALGLMVAVIAFIAVQVGYEVVDRRATSAAVRLHTESRAGEPDTARQASPGSASQAETARSV